MPSSAQMQSSKVLSFSLQCVPGQFCLSSCKSALGFGAATNMWYAQWNTKSVYWSQSMSVSDAGCVSSFLGAQASAVPRNSCQLTCQVVPQLTRCGVLWDVLSLMDMLLMHVSFHHVFIDGYADVWLLASSIYTDVS